jgi:hypothetical protein
MRLVYWCVHYEKQVSKESEIIQIAYIQIDTLCNEMLVFKVITFIFVQVLNRYNVS